MQRLSVLIAAFAVLTGCATNIKPTVTSNPAPARALKEFQQFELKPLAADPGVTEKEPAAVKKINENLNLRINSVTGPWTRAEGDTLIIEPRVREIKFVSSTQRVFTGALSGSSAVRMTVKLTDKASGAVIAEPEFYQRAAAQGGNFSLGVTDNLMLDRIAQVLAEYMQRNYSQAVGGPTGFEAAEAKKKK
jgi:hypothetical protein